SKIGYKLAPGLVLGVENYNGLGEVRSLGKFSSADQASYLTADFAVAGFDVNAGVGKGYGTSADSTTVKLVIGVPLGGK
ncbi:MAG: hypothetical protein ABIW31_08360, partial [Novosphingobium sp.]